MPLLPFHLATVPLPFGITRIEASAGTGKTYTLTALFLRLVVEKNLPVNSILVTTFTIAATAELRDRIRSRLHLALSLFTSSTPTEDPPSRVLPRQRLHLSPPPRSRPPPVRRRLHLHDPRLLPTPPPRTRLRILPSLRCRTPHRFPTPPPRSRR
ncbi:MAG: UvrD-helicase domain-containing protein [Verrucomicrobia bacterium]|nr:UvrD-helicase domain-containing protein [Verrucomicrobiota bacterium]